MGKMGFLRRRSRRKKPISSPFRDTEAHQSSFFNTKLNRGMTPLQKVILPQRPQSTQSNTIEEFCALCVLCGEFCRGLRYAQETDVSALRLV